MLYLAFLLAVGTDRTAVVGQDELESRSVNVRNRDDVGTKARSEVVPLDVSSDSSSHSRSRAPLPNKLV